MSVRFILNPISGHQHTSLAQLKEQIETIFPSAELCLTTGPGHATKLAQEAAQAGITTVIAIGGDGTLNETAKGLVNTSTALGIIPRGSGNGFARELGLLGPLARTLGKLKKATVRACDVGFANGELFLNVAGVGIEAVVAWQFMEQAKTGSRGMLPYFKSAAHTFFTYRPQTLRITSGTATYTCAPLTLVFANGRQYGSNFKVAPKASLFDGQLDVVEINPTNKLKLALAVPFFFVGKHPFDVTHITRLQHAVLESKGEILYHIDGEPRKANHRLEISLKPGALHLLVP